MRIKLSDAVEELPGKYRALMRDSSLESHPYVEAAWIQDFVSLPGSK
jgi:predicted DNA-binding protein (UPF0278 family)